MIIDIKSVQNRCMIKSYGWTNQAKFPRVFIMSTLRITTSIYKLCLSCPLFSTNPVLDVIVQWPVINATQLVSRPEFHFDEPRGHSEKNMPCVRMPALVAVASGRVASWKISKQLAYWRILKISKKLYHLLEKWSTKTEDAAYLTFLESICPESVQEKISRKPCLSGASKNHWFPLFMFP